MGAIMKDYFARSFALLACFSLMMHPGMGWQDETCAAVCFIAWVWNAYKWVKS